MKFREFKPALDEQLLAEVDAMGFTHMTPVQAATLPLFLTNKDVCVDACTGSGKTLAFVLPIVQLLKWKLDDKSIAPPKTDTTKLLSTVLSPTRELARQIFDCAARFFAKALPEVQVLLFVGGTSVEEDLRLIHQAIHKCCVVIGTPGRIEDLMRRSVGKSMDARDFEILILDEADTLLDMGFEVSINSILGFLPKQRRTGLFSATQTQEVKQLARAGLRNPATISVQLAANKNQIIPTTLRNYHSIVEYDSRLSALTQFLQARRECKCIVFFSTCCAVDFFGRVVEKLMQSDKSKVHQEHSKGINDPMEVIMLHGKMTPKKRTLNYNRFSELKTGGVLICTDVVARGIDLPDVDWIIQFDPPKDPNFFVHRVGRTARAGREGAALSFLSSNEDAYVNFLQLRKVPCEELALPTLLPEHDVIPLVKQMVCNDRDLLEKGTKAFISFVRAYKEHQCQFIFRFKELDLGLVAKGYALLQLPKINELRHVNIKTFTKAEDVVIPEIRYVDKHREKQRQEKLAAIAKLKNKKRPRDADGDDEDDNKQQAKAKAKAKALEALNAGPRRREKKKGRHQRIQEEWDELAEEERLFKQMKKGKISKAKYDDVLLMKHSLDHHNSDQDDDDPDADDDKDDDDEDMWQKKLKEQQKKLKDKFTKKTNGADIKKKTAGQRKEAQKREERIRARKKAAHVQKARQKQAHQMRKRV